VPGASLRLLDDNLHAQRLDNCRHLLGLMPHNGNNRTRLQHLTGADDVLDQAAASGAVQNFGERGLQTRTLARG
jgi:hypothetical protein